MLRRRRIRRCAIAGIVAAGLLTSGYGAWSATRASSCAVLGLRTSLGVAEDTPLGTLWSQVTVGEVIDAIACLTADAAAIVQHNAPAVLSEPELAELESLQAQRDAGTITAQECDDVVNHIVGGGDVSVQRLAGRL
jgi:hypothetical protein